MHTGVCGKQKRRKKMDVKESELVMGYLKEKILETLGCPAEIRRDKGMLHADISGRGMGIIIGNADNEQIAGTLRKGTKEERMRLDAALRKKFGEFGAVSDISKRIRGMNYAEAKKYLFLKPVHNVHEEADLEGIPFLVSGDMAFPIYARVFRNENGCYSIRVLKSMLEKWQVDEREAFRDALQNMQRIYPPRLYTVDGMEVNTKLPADPGSMEEFGYVLTNSRETYGAAAIFYPGMAEKIARLLGEDFYFACTSVHEAHIHAVSTTEPEAIEKALQDTNCSCNRPGEILTDYVYRYNSDRKGFSYGKRSSWLSADLERKTERGWERFTFDV